MKKILNFRQLAEGVTNRDGKTIKGIYRSGDPSRATPSDISELQNRGVGHIYDFRSELEVANSSLLPAGIFHTSHYDILEQAGNFDLNDVKAEYLKIDEKSMAILNQRLIKVFGLTDERHILALKTISVNRIEYIDAYFDEVIARHGDFDSYLRENFELEEEHKSLLRENYLTQDWPAV